MNMCRHILLLMTIVLGTMFCQAAEPSWAERMSRQLDKKLTLELTNEKLTTAFELVANVTGLNIIIAPQVRQANPLLTLKVQDMDAGSVVRWMTQLSQTFVEVRDQALWITDKPSKDLIDEERKELVLLGASMGIKFELPPEGTQLNNQDLMKIAMQILEKEQVKVPDFPGPGIGLGVEERSIASPFAVAP